MAGDALVRTGLAWIIQVAGRATAGCLAGGGSFHPGSLRVSTPVGFSARTIVNCGQLLLVEETMA